MARADDSIEKIIANFVEQTESGEAPDPADYLARYPDHAEELKEFFELHLEFSSGADPLVSEHSFDTERPGQQAANEGSLTSNPPRLLGDYEVLQEIDRGGMGVVYKARDRKLNRIVALKLIRSGELASDEEVQRFLSEAEAAAALVHPGIVPIYEVCSRDGLVFYTMAFIHGRSLADMVKEGALEPAEALRITHKLCAAVEFAHNSGIHHRDLKPANVLINQQGEPIIIDFGLAKVVDGDQSLTATGQLLGTPAYMPPEMAAGKKRNIGPAADVYALGAILYCLCAGQPAFSGPTPFDVLLQVLDRRPQKPSKLNRAVSKDIDLVCLRALEKDPSQRYQTADELRADLQRILTGEPIDSPKETAAQRLRKWWQREPIMAAHVLGIGVTTAIVLVAYLVRNEFTVLFYYRLGLLLTWLSVSFFLQLWVDLAKWTHVAIYSWLTIDVVIYTSLIAFADPPRSMLLIGYPMMIVASCLYYQRRFTVTTTALCIAGFLTLGQFFARDDFVKPDFGAIFVCGLVVIAVCLIAVINRVRGLSRFHNG